MPVGATLGAAALGAGAQIISGNKAAKAQTRAADASIAYNERRDAQTRADFEPWRRFGISALERLYGAYGLTPPGSTADADGGAPYGGFSASPGYQFRLDQGVQAVERSAAARGMLRSGAAAKAIQRYGEGLAASEYDAFARRLSEAAGIGRDATASTAAASGTATSNITQALIATGNARASSYANTGSAINSGINNALTAYLYSRGGGFKTGGI